jgi:hypothetical protein
VEFLKAILRDPHHLHLPGEIEPKEGLDKLEKALGLGPEPPKKPLRRI